MQVSSLQRIDNGEAQKMRHLVRGVFIAVFLLELAFGVYLGYRDVLLGDAVSRTANAYYVLNVKPYRFASMGLVWNPLPSTLQLPFVALAKLWKPFVTKGVGAAIVSALFAGWSASMFFKTSITMGVGRKWSFLLTLLFALNPYMFFYGANGMSEMISFAFTMMIVCRLTLWMKEGTTGHLVGIAMGFVGLFLTRYESVPFAAAVGLSIGLLIFFSQRERFYYQKGPKSEKWFYFEGTAILLFAPMGYAVLMWMLYSYIISGNPLYFMDSGYSMLAYSAYYTARGGFWQVFSFLWDRTWPFLVPVGAVLLVRLVRGQLFRVETLVFLICSLVLTLFQFYMLLNETSAGYVRYLCYPMIAALAWIPYELRALPEKKRSGRGAKAFVAGVMAAMALWFGWALTQDEIMREDTLLMLPEGSTQMAEHINSRYGDKRILMDAYRAYYLYMILDNQDNVVISSSENFYESVEDPAEYGVEYILVPQSGSYGDMDAVNKAYPNLYSRGADWCVEEASIGEFKLFRVTDRPSTQKEEVAEDA